jgi:Mn2+/Fe2+ NRAMP family transporter
MAYADPDNFATNLAACAGSGYLLLWVIAEIVAMVTDLAAFIRAAIAG